MEYAQSITLEQLSEGLEVDLEWVDQDDLVFPGELNQCDLREVGALAMEFCVDGVAIRSEC